MSVKKLRVNKGWSQEHLALISGLSLRTIQRVEAGNTASIETLKALASVFEVDTSKLTKTITIVDKESDEWLEVPLWVSIGLFGVKSRKASIYIEKFCLALGVIGGLAYFAYPPLSILIAFFGSAYWIAICIRWLDNENLW